MVMTSASLVYSVNGFESRTEMELDRETRTGLLFLSGLSPTGWQRSGL